jgi:WD40 repeat protein
MYIIKGVFLILLFFISDFIYAQTPELVVPVRAGVPYVMATAQNNKYLLLGNSNALQIWETAGGRLLKSFYKPTSSFAEVSDGRTVAVVSREYVHLLDLENFAFRDSVKLKEAYAVACAPNNKIYVACNSTTKRFLMVIDAVSKQMDTVFITDANKSGSATMLRVSKDGRFSMLQPNNGFTFIIENATKKLVKTFEQKSIFDFMPDNRILEIIKKDEGSTFRILNTTTFSIDVEVVGKTKAIAFRNDKLFWLNNTRLLTASSEISAIVDFQAKTVSADYKYYTGYEPADLQGKGQVKNGELKTIYRLVTYPEARLEEWDLVSNKKLRDIGNTAIAPFYIAVSPNDFRFQFGTKQEIRLGRSLRFWQYDKANGDRVAYTPDGKNRLHASTILEKFKSMDKTGERISYISYLSRAASGIHFNKGGSKVALIEAQGMLIVDVNEMKVLHDVVVGKENYMLNSSDVGCFVDNDTKVIAHGHFEDKTDRTYCVDVETGKILWSVRGYNTDFMPTTEGVLCFDWSLQKLQVLNPQTGETIRILNMGRTFKSGAAIRVSIMPDGKKAMIAESEKMFFYDIPTQKITPATQNLSTTWMWSVSHFPHKPELALSCSDDGKLILWNTVEAKPLATLYILGKSNEWVCMTPDGRFDASQGALQKMYYIKGKEIIPLEQLYEKYYTPGLVAQLIGGETPLPVDENDDIKKLKSPPSVKIKFENKQRNLTVEDDVPTYAATQAQVSLTVEATSKDDVIDEIRLFQNGKLVGGTTRNLVVEDDKKAAETKIFTVNLLEGENRFKAIALNSQRTESAPDEIIIAYKPTKTVTQTTNPTNDINLYMVVVGINKYKNPKYNLNYATADATSFKEAIEKGGNGMFNKANIIFIGDEKATKEGISTELDKVKTASNPKDVFIFYYAGHGVLNEKKDFFLVPHDVTQLYGADDALAQKGLSANVLQQYSKDIKAQKQLFILDACQSAGALDKLVAARGVAEEKAIAQLARATGTHWLTASGSEQFASEFTQLGHGTFTYVLLEALSGKADTGDKKITVKEIDGYLQEQVPEITAKYKGTPQYPASYGFGNDFPIGVVKN